MQGIRRCRHIGHRRRTLLGGPETGCGRTGFPDHPVDPGKGGLAGSTPEDEMGPQARTVKDSRGPQIDWPP